MGRGESVISKHCPAGALRGQEGRMKCNKQPVQLGGMAGNCLQMISLYYGRWGGRGGEEVIQKNTQQHQQQQQHAS